MNKKGKNRKGKIPHPTPAQLETPIDKNEDIVAGDKESVANNIISKNSENLESEKETRVPEILSEVLPLLISTKDEETPKKPKRNRGKKKKGKDIDINVEEDMGVNDPLSTVQEKNLDPSEVIKESNEDVCAVTPIAPKKKNKKKNTGDIIRDLVLSDPEQLISSTIATKSLEQESKILDNIKNTEVIETKPEPVKRQEEQEQDVKLSKKKNKKKKRNESETSDNVDISGTPDSQRAPNVKEELFEIKRDQELEAETVLMEHANSDKEVPIQKDFFQDVRQAQELVKIKEKFTDTVSMNIIDSVQQLPVLESKSKKKNKKDKKQTTRSGEYEASNDESLFQSGTIPWEKENITEDVVNLERNKDIIEIEESELCAKDFIPKHKVKIAKPVEKKHKEKEDNKVDISQRESDSLKLPITEQFSLIKSESSKSSETYKEIISDIKSEDVIQNKPLDSSKEMQIIGDQSKDSQVFELLTSPDKVESKKRKKGAKVPKTPDVSFELLEPNFESKVQQCDSPNSSQQSIVIIENIAADKPITGNTSDTNEPIIKLKAVTTESLKETKNQEHILLTPEILEEREQVQIATEIIHTIQDHKYETNSGKKRKKSPKLPKDQDKTSVSSSPLVQTPTFTEENLSCLSNTKEDIESFDTSRMTKLYDIEISSIKTDETEGAVCDIIPDITYPRSSSQQLPDDNNNSTMIREILPVLEIKSDPLVKEHLEASDVNVKEEDISPPKQEKTDLKSKMMEVNQDMEGLRLSIERSLAELSFMEKHDKDNEMQFENSKIKTEHIISKIKDDDDTKNKRHEQEKLIAALDTDKSTIQSIKQFDNVKITDECYNNKKTELPIVDSKKSFSDLISEVSELQLDLTRDSSKNTKSITETSVSSVMPMTIEEKLTETLLKFDTRGVGHKSVIEAHDKPENSPRALPTGPSTSGIAITEPELENQNTELKPKEQAIEAISAPVCPTRKDPKNKHKKKKSKQDVHVSTSSVTQNVQTSTSTQASSSTTSDTTKKEVCNSKKENKCESEKSKEKSKQQADIIESVTEEELLTESAYEPIDNFEDALTSSIDDVNQTFEIIVKESQQQSNPKINIIAPDDEKTPVAPPKNLLGHPDIPVRSNKRDYKKEKDKIPNEVTAKVKIQDSVEIEGKQSKNTQTVNKLKGYKMGENEDFIYKYNFRKVFLQNICHKCKKDLAGSRLACCYCNLVFYCGIKHKDEDWPQHQALCFAVSTIGHLKNQKHIYADAKNITGHDYRLIRMQMIVSCEKILKRRLVPWEQEALLYPRICVHVPCREWRQIKLTDCQGCGQISYCAENPDHYPKSHSRWCKSYNLYQKLVSYQQTKGRLEPKLPTKVMQAQYEIPDKINEVLAAMYEEKINMNDIQYAALTQLATAPLTAAYCYQVCCKKNVTAISYKNPSFTVHVVGAELQFEADALNKWEVFFLHLRPELQELRIVLINSNLNPSNLPLELLGKIKLCEDCRQKKRRVIFSFQEKSYADYKLSESFVLPDIVCAFNPSIQRSSVYNGKDPWPSTVNVIVKQKIPFIITAYTLTELHKDCTRIKECAEPEFNFVSEPKLNNFASIRPDRNFISDDEMPLMFKNYCFAIICG